MKRRNFLLTGVASAAYVPLRQQLASNSNELVKSLKLGFVGVGFRGRDHLAQAILRPDVEIAAICDIDPEAISITQEMLKKAGRPKAKVFSKSENDYENLLKIEELEGIVISTPWEWHVPMSIASMKAGKYTAVEVSATVTLKESWDLIHTFEKTGSHLMLLENVCYRRDVMAVLNMVRKGMFGEMTYAHCGYQHDLRNVKFNNGKEAYVLGAEFGEKGYSEARWRTQHSVDRNGDLYPTHGLGPVAHWFNINRGNYFKSLSSISTKSRGLHNYIVKNGGKGHANANVKFKLGDIVTTTIVCENGENIVLIHDTNSPRPYSLGFRAQGTQGIWMDDGDNIYFEGLSPQPHRWEEFKIYQEKYEHPLWKNYAQDAENAGHGGIDYFVFRAFVESIKNKVAPPIDVYDAAVWSAISPLSEESVAKGGVLVDFPDFTKGKWKTNTSVFGLGDF